MCKHNIEGEAKLITMLACFCLHYCTFYLGPSCDVRMHFLLSLCCWMEIGWAVIAGLTDNSGLDLEKACVWACFNWVLRLPLTGGAGQRDSPKTIIPWMQWMQLLALILAVLLWEENNLSFILPFHKGFEQAYYKG